MSFSSKRQKFVNELRQKQREEILKKHRNQNISDRIFTHRTSTSSQNQSLGSSGLSHNQSKNFVFQNELLKIVDHHEVQIAIKNGLMLNILNCMPKWISKLSIAPAFTTVQNKGFGKPYTQQQNNKQQKILHIFLNIAINLLKNNIYTAQITNCLVQLTGLPKIYLNFRNIKQESLASQFIPIINNLIQQSVNMQVIINCVYICCNLHNGFVNLNSLNQYELEQFWLKILVKLGNICNQYPNYQNCLQNVLWFMRNCLLVNKTKRCRDYFADSYLNISLNISQTKNIKTESNQQKQLFNKNFQYQCLIIISQVVAYLCIHLSSQSQSYKLIDNTQNHIRYQSVDKVQYYHSILYSAFNVIFLIVSDTGYQNIQQVTKNMKNNSYQGYQDYMDCLRVVDEIICKYLSTLCHKNQLTTKSCQKQLKVVSLILQQIAQCYCKYKINNQLPQSMVSIALLASQGKLKFAQSMYLCMKVFELSWQANNKIAKLILLKFFRHAGEIFSDKQIVSSRDYRVVMLSFVQCLQDTLSWVQVANILQQAHKQQTKHNISQHMQMQMQQQKQFLNTNKQKQQLKLIFQKFMQNSLLPQILNILQLMLIDQDSQNRAIGLKIILKLTTNWELDIDMMRNMVINMGINNKIIQLQQEPQQSIYNCALDLIQELKLDEEY